MSDELASIDGITPNVVISDGETVEVKSLTSKSVYIIKRTMDHYYCNCPAWRNQSGVPVNARTCKHLRSKLGDAYEDARLNLKNPDGPGKKAAPTKKAASAKKFAPAKKATTSKKKSEEADEEEEEQEEVRPKKKPASKTTTVKKPASTRSLRSKNVKDESEAEEQEEEEEKAAKPPSRTRAASKPRSGAAVISAKKDKKPATKASKGKVEDIEEEQDVDGDEKMPDIPAAEGLTDDELAVIAGIKPHVFLADGEEMQVESQTSTTKYKIKRTWDHFYCSCPAWRNQSGAPVNARTCKHLKATFGEEYEIARLKMKNPDGQVQAASKPSTKGKRKKQDADDEEGEDDAAPAKKKTKTSVPELVLANKWDGADPAGWWVSEKLDGVRVYYDGKCMMSRLGNAFTPPKEFLDSLPKDVTLDGELFGGRGKFQDTVSIVKTVNSPHWKTIYFHVFDVPSMGSEPFEDRMKYLNDTFGASGKSKNEKVKVVEQALVKDSDHVLEMLKEVEAAGGEGLMLRKPKSLYEGRRSATLLKVKSFYDAEARVTGYTSGKGKHANATGALICEMESGKAFHVGTGLSDKQRQNPPKIGSIISYRFQELTRDKVPRFPVFVGEVVDKTEPKDAEVREVISKED